jgi:hypothetical protein
MTRSVLARLLGAATGALCLSIVPVEAAAPLPPELAQFRAERADMALALSEPIAKCVARHDTGNPAFHGCIDWHSSVHGTWALTAYTWATHDERYRPLILSILQPARLEQEQKHLEDDPSFEMPYGRAWFLRLAIDYRKAFNNDLLEAFADRVAASILAYYTHLEPSPTAIAYDSATWALINLYDYAVMRQNAEIIAFVKAKVRAHYLAAGRCPALALETDTGEFMAVCTNWAWLVEKTLPHEEFIAWLAHFLPPEPPLEPIASPNAVHQVGLNFSRTWGLWALYRATDDRRYFDAYLRHFRETYANPAFWKGDYHTVAHWVAQFGMLGLVLTYYDVP